MTGPGPEKEIEGPYELSEGWVWTHIPFISTNHDRKRIPVKDKDRQKMKGVYPYYGASGIIDHVNDYLFDGEYLLIGEDGANLISRTTQIAFKASGKFWVNNHAHVLKIKGGIPIEFVEGYINRTDLIPYVTGSAQPKLTQKKLEFIPIPLPPPPSPRTTPHRHQARNTSGEGKPLQRPSGKGPSANQAFPAERACCCMFRTADRGLAQRAS